MSSPKSYGKHRRSRLTPCLECGTLVRKVGSARHTECHRQWESRCRQYARALHHYRERTVQMSVANMLINQLKTIPHVKAVTLISEEDDFKVVIDVDDGTTYTANDKSASQAAVKAVEWFVMSRYPTQ